MWNIYTVDFYSCIRKDKITVFCDHMYGFSQYHAKWNKSDRKNQHLYDLTRMWDIVVKSTSEQTKTQRHRKQGEGGGGY